MITTGVSCGRRPIVSQERVDVLGVLDVDPGVRQTRVLGERAQAHRLGRVARADDPDRLRALPGSQELAARDERAEDRLGERRANAHQPAELGLLDHQHPPGLRDTAGQKAALAGQQGQLADEVARPERGDDDLLRAVGRTTSTSPSSTTNRSYDASPASNSNSPAATWRSLPNAAISCSCDALSSGAIAGIAWAFRRSSREGR